MSLRRCLSNSSFKVEAVYTRDSPDGLTPSPKHCLKLERLRSSKHDDLDLITRVCLGLGPRATLHVVEGADHSFSVLKRSGRSDDRVLDELADTITDWARTV